VIFINNDTFSIWLIAGRLSDIGTEAINKSQNSAISNAAGPKSAVNLVTLPTKQYG